MTTNAKLLRRKQFATGLAIQLVALATLAIFRSDKLVNFTYDLPPNAINDVLVMLAEYWNEMMIRGGVSDVAAKAGEMIGELRGELGN